MSLVTVAEVSEIASRIVDIALEKLIDRVIDIADHLIIDALEICGPDHNKVFVCQAIRNAL